MLVKLGIQWIGLSDLIVTSTDTTYKLQVREGHTLFYSIGETIPDSNEGYVVTGGESFDYTVTEDKDLYLRSGDMAMVNISEAASGGGIQPTGTINITENGVYDVTNYASADVQVEGGETITVTNYSSTPVTEGEQVLIAKWWDSTLQQELYGIRDRGWFSTNDDTLTGVALADADVNENVDVKVLLGEFYYASLTFDTVPPTAIPHTTYFNRYEGGNYIENRDEIDVPYYTTVTGVVKAEGYKPYAVNTTVETEDVELHIELEPAQPLLIITNPGTGNYYYADDLDNISFTSGANAATMNGPILSDGNGLYVGDGATSSTEYYYSADAVNWTAVDCGFENPVLTLNNGSIIANSTNETTYLKLDADDFEEGGEKTNATNVLLNGGFGDYISYGYDSTNEELFSNWTLYPEFTYQLSTKHSTNVVEKWGFAWVVDFDDFTQEGTLHKIDGEIITSEYNGSASGYCFLVDAGNELLLINQNNNYDKMWAITYNNGTVSVSERSYPLNDYYFVSGACYYNGVLYLLAGDTSYTSVVLYKSEDNGLTWTSVTATALSSLPINKGNLLTIGYI